MIFRVLNGVPVGFETTGTLSFWHTL